jgi:membrane-bound metal-dependent hydrolase YbcI (DUF457 family)
MIAVTLFALALFVLAVAAVLTRSKDRAHARSALIVAVALALLAGGLSIAGAVRWSGCFRGPNGVYIRATHSGGTRVCPDTTFGLRDPF